MIRDNFHAEEGAVFGDDLDTGYNVVLRQNCHVGWGVKIWSNTVIDAGAVIGDNTRIHCNCYIAQACIVEGDVFIGPGTQLLNDKYPVQYDPDLWKPVVIQQSAVIGGGVTILPGVTIGERAMIGGGSVVTKDVGPGEVWFGSPATRRKSIEQYWSEREAARYAIESK